MVLIPYAKGEIARGIFWVKEPLRSSKTCVGDGLDAQGKMVSRMQFTQTFSGIPFIHAHMKTHTRTMHLMKKNLS